MSFFEIVLLIIGIVVVLLCVDIWINLQTFKHKLNDLGVQYQHLSSKMSNISSGQKNLKFKLDLLEKNEDQNFMDCPIMDSG